MRIFSVLQEIFSSFTAAFSGLCNTVFPSVIVDAQYASTSVWSPPFAKSDRCKTFQFDIYLFGETAGDVAIYIYFFFRGERFCTQVLVASVCTLARLHLRKKMKRPVPHIVPVQTRPLERIVVKCASDSQFRASDTTSGDENVIVGGTKEGTAGPSLDVPSESEPGRVFPHTRSSLTPLCALWSWSRSIQNRPGRVCVLTAFCDTKTNVRES